MQRSYYAYSRSRFALTGVCAFMKMGAFDCQAVLRPLTLDMDQCALPFTKKKVLQGGDWKQFLVSELAGTFHTHS